MKINQAKVIQNRKYYFNRLKIIWNYLHIQNATVLDLGCGEQIVKELCTRYNNLYTGIDQIPFSHSKNFVSGDILDENLCKKYQADYIYLLGVLDYMEYDQKQTVLNLWKDSFHKAIIVSQRNPLSLLNVFYLRKKPVIDIHTIIKTDHFVKLYLMKLPFSGKVFDFTKIKFIRKYLSTECILIILKDRE